MCLQGYYHLEKWSELAKAREKGQTEAKRRQQMMLSAKEEEDLATVVAAKTPDPQPEQHPEEEMGAVGGEAPPPYPRVYPQLPVELQEATKAVTRREMKDRGITIEYTKHMGKNPIELVDATGQHYTLLQQENTTHPSAPIMASEMVTPLEQTQPYNFSMHSSPQHDIGAYPMIQVANPRAGQLINPDNAALGVHPDTILVHRPWTDGDIDDALKGIVSPSEDVTEFLEDMAQLKASYNLNGNEVERVYRKALGHHWASVRGSWDPIHNGQVLPHDEGELTNRLNALRTRINNRFVRRANYMEINRTKQKDGESFEEFKHRMIKVFKVHSGLEDIQNNENCPYRQQLKMPCMQTLFQA